MNIKFTKKIVLTPILIFLFFIVSLQVFKSMGYSKFVIINTNTPVVQIEKKYKFINDDLIISTKVSGFAKYAQLHIGADMKNNSFFEVYENDKKIVRVDKVNKQEINIRGNLRMTFFHNDGRSSIATAAGFLVRDHQDNWKLISDLKPPEPDNKIDLAIFPTLGGVEYFDKAGIFNYEKKDFGLTLIKYPVIDHRMWFPPLSVTVPWKITVKYDRGTYDVLDKFSVHYFPVYFE